MARFDEIEMTAAERVKLAGVEASADVTDSANVDGAGAVMESDYNAQTILGAVTDDTPAAITVGASTIVGRTAAGDVAALSAADARTVLNVADGAEVNPAVVSQVDAEAGAATDERIWTAERVKQAITALAPEGETWVDTARTQRGSVSPWGSGTQLNPSGMEGTATTENDAGSSFDIDDNGAYLQQDTAASAGSDAESYGPEVYATTANPLAVFNVEVNDWTSVRHFAGLTSASNNVDADDPIGHHLGVQFSSDRGDAAFRTMTKNGTTQTLGLFTPTVVPVNGKFYILETDVSADGTTATLTLRDEDKAVLGVATVTATLPTVTQEVRVYSGLETRAAAVRSLKQYGWDVQQGRS